MARALSVYQVLNEKRATAQFSGSWLQTIGNPELAGSWIIWGQSSNGKTTFCMMLAKYLCGFDRVLYNSLEEGAGRTIQIALARADMQQVARKFTLLDGESIEDLKTRFLKNSSFLFLMQRENCLPGVWQIEYDTTQM